MSRRPRAELEREPHHIYIHYDKSATAIYVGRTCDPDTRPHVTKNRPWVKSESSFVEISPAMTYEAACWTEAEMIRSLRPKHNHQQGQRIINEDDWRVDEICRIENVTRATARKFLPIYPKGRDEFYGYLQGRLQKRIEIFEEAERRGVSPDVVADEVARNTVDNFLSEALAGVKP